MKDHQREFPVGKMCKVLKVSRSGFYDWRNNKPSNRDSENRMLLSEIMRIHGRSKASYGSPRITEEPWVRRVQAAGGQADEKEQDPGRPCEKVRGDHRFET